MVGWFDYDQKTGKASSSPVAEKLIEVSDAVITTVSAYEFVIMTPLLLKVHCCYTIIIVL
jgi:hypothetical protein